MAHLQWKMQSSKILSGKDLYLVASEKGLQCISNQTQKHPMASLLSDSKILANSVQQLNEYFEGQRKVFNLELDLKGTPFQQMVWRILKGIEVKKILASIGKSFSVVPNHFALRLR